jgi:hypothetical protein
VVEAPVQDAPQISSEFPRQRFEVGVSIQPNGKSGITQTNQCRIQAEVWKTLNEVRGPWLAQQCSSLCAERKAVALRHE